MTQAEKSQLLMAPHAIVHFQVAMLVVLHAAHAQLLCTAPGRRHLRPLTAPLFMLAAPCFLVRAPLPLPVEESHHAVKRSSRSHSSCGGSQTCGVSGGRWWCTAATLMLTAPSPLAWRPSTQEHGVGRCVIRVAVVRCGSLDSSSDRATHSLVSATPCLFSF